MAHVWEVRDLRSRLVCVTWSLLLAGALLGPALAPGFVLSYDMVWVPDLALRTDFLGLASGLPRAVPSDAVVASLDEVVPGMLLQKLVLAGGLVAGGLGAARLAPSSLPARLAAIGLYQWNPLVVERLVIGHWPVLLGYAGLPWLIVLARRWRDTGSMPPALWFLVPLGSLSASAGLITAVVLVATAAGARRNRAIAAVLGLANAPWLVAGLLHVGVASADPVGAQVFALHDEGRVPGPIAALTLGGIWNSEVVPDSRSGVLGWIALLVVLLLAAAGVRSWWSRADRRDRAALTACWAAGWVVATLTWLTPGLVGVLGAQVPGLGLLRDGARMLVLCAPLLVLLVAHGVGELYRRLSVSRIAAAAATVAAVLLPVAMLPDAAWGAGGSLRAVGYPASYDAARDSVASAAANGAEGDVLLLPLSSYRRPDWNHGRKVLDPLGRYLTPNYVGSDVLIVSGVAVAGEDPRVAEARDALAAASPDQRAERLAAMGIEFVAVEPDAPGAEAVPAVAGEELIDTGDVRVVIVADARQPRSTPARIVAVGAAWGGYVGTLVIGCVAILNRRRRRCYPVRGS